MENLQVCNIDHLKFQNGASVKTNLYGLLKNYFLFKKKIEVKKERVRM